MTRKYTSNLDFVFHSLSDPIRRDILHRVAAGEHSVSELVAHYDISFVATAKHIHVLEKAHVIVKRKEGKNIRLRLLQVLYNHPTSILSSFVRYGKVDMIN